MQSVCVFRMSVGTNRDYSHVTHLHVLRINCLLKHPIEEKIKGSI